MTESASVEKAKEKNWGDQVCFFHGKKLRDCDECLNATLGKMAKEILAKDD